MQKLENLYRQRAEVDRGDAVVRMIAPLLRTAGELKNAFEAANHVKGSVPGLGYVSGDARGVID